MSLVSRIDGVQAPQRVGLSMTLGGIVGATVGLLAGLVLALLLGTRRSPVRRASDLRVLPGDLRVFGPPQRDAAVIRTATLCSSFDRPLAVVLGLPGAEADVAAVRDEFLAELHRNRLRTFKVESDSLVPERAAAPAPATKAAKATKATKATKAATQLQPVGARTSTSNGEVPDDRTNAATVPAVPAEPAVVPPLGLPQRRQELAKLNADIMFISGSADPALVNRLAGRAEVVLLVARQGATRMTDIAQVTETLTTSAPSTILITGR